MSASIALLKTRWMESRITFGSSAEPRKRCGLWDRALAPTGFIILSKYWYTNSSYSHRTVDRIKCLCFSHVWFFCDPDGLYPTRLLCPWDSPGRNTGVGCHFLLQGIFLTQGSNPPPSHMSPALTGGFFTTSIPWEALKEVRCVKNLTQCFAHRIHTLNKSQSLLPESDYVPCPTSGGYVPMTGDILDATTGGGMLLAPGRWS